MACGLLLAFAIVIALVLRAGAVAAGAALASSISAALFVRRKKPRGYVAKANAEDGRLPRSLNA